MTRGYRGRAVEEENSVGLSKLPTPTLGSYEHPESAEVRKGRSIPVGSMLQRSAG